MTGNLPSPKRGAFPTPKSEVEKAVPYIPETDHAGDQSTDEAAAPPNDDQINNSHQNK